MIRLICLLVVFTFLMSCKQKTGREKMVEFMNDTTNNILQKQMANGVEMIVKYMPVVYQKNTEVKTKDDNGEEYLQNILLDVKISMPGLKKDKATTLYLIFDIQNDFQLQVGDKLLFPAICQKIENGIRDNYEYMIAFETSPLENSSTKQAEFFYRDKIFGVGERQFIFRKKDILKIPMPTTN